MPSVRHALTLFSVLVLGGALAADEVKRDEFKLSQEEQEVLNLTNQQRAAAGLPPLRPNEKLFKAARDHSLNMAARNYLSHNLGGGPGERLAAVGYTSSGWAENVAMGQQTPAEVLQSWLNSRGHRANIFSQHAEIGIGVAVTAGGARYWTQVFANP